jgi:antirestriction protein ArdC
MRQANQVGGHVREREESTLILYWKIEDAKKHRADSHESQVIKAT